MRGRRMRGLRAAALIATGAFALTACSSAAEPADTASGDGETGGADVAAAEEFLAPWMGEGEKNLLIDEPLETWALRSAP